MICLIDGDGAIFSHELVAEGHFGGLKAAEKLSDAMNEYLSTKHGINQIQLWVYVFYNKQGLVDTYGRANLLEAKENFDEFVLGFNQAAERFIMVDVGGSKEAADTKLKGMGGPLCQLASDLQTT